MIAHDLRLWIVGAIGGLYTLNLDNPAAGFTKRNMQGTGGTGHGVGAVYHQPSRAILAWHNYGTTVRRLSVPSLAERNLGLVGYLAGEQQFRRAERGRGQWHVRSFQHDRRHG